MRNDYLKIIKDQEDHLSNSTTGSSNTNRNTNKYTNHNHNNNAHLSACKRAAKQVLASALEKNERPQSYEFCVLIGNTLTGYENLTAFRRGDHPIVSIEFWETYEYGLFFLSGNMKLYDISCCMNCDNLKNVGKNLISHFSFCIF